MNDTATVETSERLYRELKAARLDVLMDDREERAGVKFKDADLIGIPYRIVLGAEKVRAFIASESRLAYWKQPLEDTLRGAEHTLDPVSERIVAQAGTIADSGQSVRTAFVNADMPYPSVKLSPGETVRLDAAGYTRYRAVANRDDRRLVFREFWKTYGAFTRTLGTTLNAQVRRTSSTRPFAGSTRRSRRRCSPTTCRRRCTLQFNAAVQQQQPRPGFSALNVEGSIRHPQKGGDWEYSVGLCIRDSNGAEISRQVVGVGALRPSEERTFSLSVEVTTPGG